MEEYPPFSVHGPAGYTILQGQDDAWAFRGLEDVPFMDRTAGTIEARYFRDSTYVVVRRLKLDNGLIQHSWFFHSSTIRMSIMIPASELYDRFLTKSLG